MLRRRFVGNTRVLNLALGTHQPLCQGRFRNKKGTGYFACRKPAESTQSQRDLRFAVKRRMTAREDQPQPIIRNFTVEGLVSGRGV
jgi:hypothetical protein